MRHKRARTILKYLLVTSGITGLLLAALFALFGLLGMIGVLADVGPDENKQIGTQALWIASVPFTLGVTALVGGLLIRRTDQAR